jgi:DNA repair exonuclease SbcCD nuclease subunit
MSEVRLITSSDEHLAESNPGFRKDSYKDAILSKLEWQGEFAKEFSANAILRGGDLFHSKISSATTHSLVSKVIKIHKNYPCPTHVTIGNHDMNYDNLDTLPKQPVNVLFESDVFKSIDSIFYSGTLKVRVVGIPYSKDNSIERLQSILKKKKDDEYLVAVVHALASNAPSEKIQSFFKEPVFDYRDLVFNGCPDVYVFGHYHKDQGVQDVHGTKFINLGAISRGALTFENLERKPKIGSIIFNSQGISVEEHIVPHKDAAEVFDLERKKKLDQERKGIEDFIKVFKQNSQVHKDPRSFMDSIDWNNFGEDLRKLTLEIIEAAESGGTDEALDEL